MQVEMPGVTAEQVKNKWNNLKMKDHKFKDNEKKTGESRKNPPPAFDAIDAVLGDRPAARPVNRRSFDSKPEPSQPTTSQPVPPQPTQPTTALPVTSPALVVMPEDDPDDPQPQDLRIPPVRRQQRRQQRLRPQSYAARMEAIALRY
ncbi:hypothetical protein Pcinc_005747 [Petrolisthes cinctipes]|uniref:Uncharacterized protein n=1 Tax=Petrolisthes cinctipes TaxID=88211 RepID=A0AAE1L067_PETCI|nr:hypothetical protein Pcinc_005747 [Petrolisthes cinctipes]